MPATPERREGRRPVFAPDFEVARGRATEKGGAVNWVRLRREFPATSTLTNVQFLATDGPRGLDEKLVFHVHASRPGEPLQISLEHEADGDPTKNLSAESRPNRIRLERFGSPSLVLARCPKVDQSAYEGLFRTAAERFAAFRAALRVRSVVGAELNALKARKTKR